eukprot:CAMPEP_0172327588 /NCGR_PEP_ID=MMETSP1058-20130122/59909_1 /TAXON_ID=83371 /ORGANISM="Detonula confervacea, Strain CCMP 353" /LENGTH=443 /DNA_ID=CAMNT_0013044669 /DNA_START=490 /DNA_END=1821 /DNA_ORIENTATION=+
MAIDITNHQIGIALAYHRQQTLPQHTDTHEDGPEPNNTVITTSLTALPPIPYMSSDPYHPSYAFLHHHRPEAKNTIRSLDRVDRTMEVADQLAQLAIDRKVKGILVRWPGDLASAVSGGESNTESSREAEEGQLLFPVDANRRNRGGVRNAKSDGSMGYMRGRILYVLDACCSSHGHNKSNVPSEPLLMAGLRPFALCDTSVSEQNWISYQQQNNHIKPVHPRLPKRQDKYGNSHTEMDLWGRAAIFGNQPPQPKEGKFYHSSKQQYFGYRVSSQFGLGSSADGKGARNLQSRNENFDSLHDNESRMNQFQGSLSAMHALHDFVKENLQGRITLPLWASAATSASSNTRKEQLFDEGSLEENYNGGDLGYQTNSRRSSRPVIDAASASSASKKPTTVDVRNGKSSNLRVGTSSHAESNKKPNGLASLVQIPKRKARRRGKRGS